MNSVSWFLYLVDVSRGIQTIFVLAAVSCLVLAFILGFYGITLRDTNSWDNAYEERRAKGVSLHWKTLWLSVPIFVFFGLSILIPSKDTLYMIGASQIGEQIIALEEVQEVGGEVGGLAKDTIALLREKIQSSLSETDK